MSFQIDFADENTVRLLLDLKAEDHISVRVKCSDTGVHRDLIAIPSKDSLFVDFFDEHQKKEFTWSRSLLTDACRSSLKKLNKES